MDEISVLKKRQIAKDLIDLLDNETERKWTTDEGIIDAFIQFHESVSKTGYEKIIPANDSELILKIDECVNRFYSNSDDYHKPDSEYSDKESWLMSNDIAKLRTELSSYLYFLSRRYFKKLSIQKATAEARKDKAEAIAYKKVYSEQISIKDSPSFADSFARKMYKADETYLEEILKADADAQEYWEAIRVFEQAKEVLNAMSPKRN